MTIKILNAIIAVVGGVAGAIVVYWLLNKLAELLPGKWEDRVKPYLYLLPALAAIGLYLIYPTIQTFVYSLREQAAAPRSSASTTTRTCSPRRTSRTRCSTRSCGSCSRRPGRS